MWRLKGNRSWLGKLKFKKAKQGVKDLGWQESAVENQRQNIEGVGEIDLLKQVQRKEVEIAGLRRELLLVSDVNGRDSLTIGSDVSVISNGKTGPVECRLGMEEVAGLIPEFRPGSHACLTAIQWIDVVEGMRKVHHWSDQRTMLYASLRLKDAGKFWYQSRQKQLMTWAEFKMELIVSFPSAIDESAIHIKLMSRKRKSTEAIETYFYEVVSLAKRANLNECTTIKYLISGLDDRNLMNVLTASNCQTSIDVLYRVKSYEGIAEQERNRAGFRDRQGLSIHNQRSIPYQSKRSGFNSLGQNQIDSNQQQTGNEPESSRFDGKCYQCGKYGHRAITCRVLTQNWNKPVMEGKEFEGN